MPPAGSVGDRARRCTRKVRSSCSPVAGSTCSRHWPPSLGLRRSPPTSRPAKRRGTAGRRGSGRRRPRRQRGPAGPGTPARSQPERRSTRCSRSTSGRTDRARRARLRRHGVTRARPHRADLVAVGQGRRTGLIDLQRRQVRAAGLRARCPRGSARLGGRRLRDHARLHHATRACSPTRASSSRPGSAPARPSRSPSAVISAIERNRGEVTVAPLGHARRRQHRRGRSRAVGARVSG